jgi:hypothetical protein
VAAASVIAKVAARDPGVRFLVSMAGSGIGAAEQETYRTGALMRRAGFPEAEIARAQEFQRRKVAVARTGLGWPATDSTMQRLRGDGARLIAAGTTSLTELTRVTRDA